MAPPSNDLDACVIKCTPSRDVRNVDRFPARRISAAIFDQWTEVDLPDKYHWNINEIIINFNTVYSYDGPNNEMNLLQYISIQNTLAA